MTEDPDKIEVVVNDYTALNRGVNEVADRSTLATRLLAAKVGLEKVKVLLWAVLVIGLLFILLGIAIFIARGDLDLSWGEPTVTLKFLQRDRSRPRVPMASDATCYFFYWGWHPTSRAISPWLL